MWVKSGILDVKGSSFPFYVSGVPLPSSAARIFASLLGGIAFCLSWAWLKSVRATSVVDQERSVGDAGVGTSNTSSLGIVLFLLACGLPVVGHASVVAASPPSGWPQTIDLSASQSPTGSSVLLTWNDDLSNGSGGASGTAPGYESSPADLINLTGPEAKVVFLVPATDFAGGNSVFLTGIDLGYGADWVLGAVDIDGDDDGGYNALLVDESAAVPISGGGYALSSDSSSGALSIDDANNFNDSSAGFSDPDDPVDVPEPSGGLLSLTACGCALGVFGADGVRRWRRNRLSCECDERTGPDAPESGTRWFFSRRRRWMSSGD
jgi:hypothetical protein